MKAFQGTGLRVELQMTLDKSCRLVKFEGALITSDFFCQLHVYQAFLLSWLEFQVTFLGHHQVYTLLN